jgi:hypothetical protein
VFEKHRRFAVRDRVATGTRAAPEAPLFSAFPEYADLAGEDGRDRLTIHHVLTMTMGTDWDESSLLYSDPRNGETAMDNAADRYRYILERRVVDTPGAYWTYCGGATALLARMIAKGSGKTLHQFARENLLDSLGVGPTEWATGAYSLTLCLHELITITRGSETLLLFSNWFKRIFIKSNQHAETLYVGRQCCFN